MGISTSIAASASMKQPTTRSSTLTINRKTSGFVDNAVNHPPNSCGIRATVRQYPSSVAVITSAITTPVVSTVSIMSFGKSRQVNSR